MGDEKIPAFVQEPVKKARLYEAIILLSSLISLSHSIRVFSVKWQSVRSKLEELLSNLSAIENGESRENFLLLVSVENILVTLKECSELAKRCSELSYSGKLLMQSDLDVICSRLDSHIWSISDIYEVGLMKQSDAIIVPRPSLSSSKDDVKFYVTDLLSRMRIGSREMKHQALIEFNEVVEEDDRYIRVAMEVDSFVCVLVKFLDFQQSEIQEEAVKSVSSISGFDCYKSMLIIAGVISPLIRLLMTGNEASKVFAARCLMKVTENSENSWAVSAHGGVTALLKICGNSGESMYELVGLCCMVLKNLVNVEEIKRFMVEEGAVSVFLKLTGYGEEIIQTNSLDLLQSLGYGDEQIRKLIVEEGGIQAFIQILDPKSSNSTRTREMAFKGIVNLFSSCHNSLNLLRNYRFLNHILHLLRYGEVSVQELAMKAAFWLSGTSKEAKKSMGEEGYIPVLVKFLDFKASQISEMAIETLSNMLIIPQNRKKFVQDEQNVSKLLQMLDPREANSGTKKLLLSILMLLITSNTAKKKIVNSIYLKNIEKLAEDEVLDAKKIVRKLSCNRFQSMISGIWHT